MSQIQPTAPLGRCAKSPGGARNPNQIDLAEIASFVDARKHVFPTQARVAHDYIDCMAGAIRELHVPLSHPAITEAMREISAHARLLRQCDEDQYQGLQRMVRCRITHPSQSDRTARLLWLALWSVTIVPIDLIDMISLADAIDEVQRSIHVATRYGRAAEKKNGGGLAAQRSAWADADR